MAVFNLANLEHQKIDFTDMVDVDVTKPALVVFDPSVADMNILAAGLPDAATILHLRIGEEPLKTIATVLEEAEAPFGSLHIVSHGAPGVIQLLDLTLSAEILEQHAAPLNRIGDALPPDAYITLTACEVAYGDTGHALLLNLARLTSRHVFGTSSIVGKANPASFAFSGTDEASGFFSPALFSMESRKSYTANLPLTPVDLTDISDDGVSRTDNVTSITAPTISFSADLGDVLEIDWDDGNGFVAAGLGTGGQQIATAPGAYASDGTKAIIVRANGSVTETLTITIDTTPSIIDTIVNTNNLSPGPGLERV